MRYLKDPDAVLDFDFDWSAKWLATGETISTFTVSRTGDVVIDSSAQSGGVVTVWLSGGTAGTTATVTCRITTNQGRTDDRTITVRIAQR
jgi:hypothetical protein